MLSTSGEQAVSPRAAKILKQVQLGDVTPLKRLQAGAPNFHWSVLKYKTGDTALHCAARLGHLDVVRYLLSYDPPGVDCRNNDDKTPLHEAAQFSRPDVAKLLLERRAHVDALKRADWTPLMLASTKDSLETVELLLENGAAVNYRNKDGWSSVHLGARTGCADVVRLLVDRGGDFGLRTKNGRSALHVAALHGRLEVVEMLLQRGLDVDVRDDCGNTPLHEAVLGRNLDVCRALVGKGADINCRNNADFTLLHLASSEGCNEVIEFVVRDLVFNANVSNCMGFTGLHCAARNGRKQAYRFLKDLGCDPDVADKFGRTAGDYLKI